MSPFHGERHTVPFPLAKALCIYFPCVFRYNGALFSYLSLSLFEPLFLYFRASALDTFISVFRSFLPCCMCVSVLVQLPLFFSFRFFPRVLTTCLIAILRPNRMSRRRIVMKNKIFQGVSRLMYTRLFEEWNKKENTINTNHVRQRPAVVCLASGRLRRRRDRRPLRWVVVHSVLN